MTKRTNRRPSPASPSADDDTDEPMASLGEAGASLKQPAFPSMSRGPTGWGGEGVETALGRGESVDGVWMGFGVAGSMTKRTNRRPSPASPSANDDTDEPMASLGEAGASLKQPAFPSTARGPTGWGGEGVETALGEGSLSMASGWVSVWRC